MKQITTITSQPKQRMQLVLDNSETADFRLYYSARQESWYYDISYKDFTAKGFKVVLSPNSLRCFRRILPFGIGFDTDGYVEPFQIDDFSTNRVKMYVLNEEDVRQIEELLFTDDNLA